MSVKIKILGHDLIPDEIVECESTDDMDQKVHEHLDIHFDSLMVRSGGTNDPEFPNQLITVPGGVLIAYAS